MHLRAQFARLGVEVPFHPRAGLCTMRAAGQAMPWARRSLIERCAAAGLPNRRRHTALDDAAAPPTCPATSSSTHPTSSNPTTTTAPRQFALARPKVQSCLRILRHFCAAGRSCLTYLRRQDSSCLRKLRNSQVDGSAVARVR